MISYIVQKKTMFYSILVEPVIKLPVDGLDNSQSQMSSEEEDVAQPPVGDIAILTASVSENASVPSRSQADEPTAASVRVFTTKKNKGVGKGSSGSSGPPPKKKPSATVTRPATPSSSESSSSDEAEEDGENATQTITVGSKRGYSIYPAYIFDVPPKKLKTDTLRKKLMISEIKRSETQTEFYERGMVLMGHLKEFLKQMIMSGQYGESSKKKHSDEHAYALNTNDTDDDEDMNQKSK